MKSNKKIIVFVLVELLIIIVLTILALNINPYPIANNEKIYYAEDFNIEIIKSDKDKNENGIDDYTDILLGAKKEAENKPIYKSQYYEGGYPPDSEGVCTDVIWRALKNAGYSLKDMIDEDIKNNTEAYPRVNGKPDSNIDFRRVPNLKVYFERNAQVLTKDLEQIDQWQPGDIVVFGNDHVAIISDKRNAQGIPYIIHNASQPNREEDAIIWWKDSRGITGHFRM